MRKIRFWHRSEAISFTKSTSRKILVKSENFDSKLSVLDLLIKLVSTDFLPCVETVITGKERGSSENDCRQLGYLAMKIWLHDGKTGPLFLRFRIRFVRKVSVVIWLNLLQVTNISHLWQTRNCLNIQRVSWIHMGQVFWGGGRSQTQVLTNPQEKSSWNYIILPRFTRYKC